MCDVALSPKPCCDPCDKAVAVAPFLFYPCLRSLSLVVQGVGAIPLPEKVDPPANQKSGLWWVVGGKKIKLFFLLGMRKMVDQNYFVQDLKSRKAYQNVVTAN